MSEELKKFTKHDNCKLKWYLLPFHQLEQVVQVLHLGSIKYSDFNWQKCTDGKRYLSACFRHIVAWVEGEKVDKETGVSHLAHAICCLFFLMWFDDNKK